MDPSELEAFPALSRELHFGRAAERLHLSHSRVSQLIRSLERDLGGALFTRTSRKVEPTPLGARAQDILGPAYEALLAAYAETRAIAQGVTGALCVGFLPVAVAGAPVEEDHTGWGMPHAAEMTHVLRQAGVPVAACWGVPESANHWWVVSLAPDWHERTGLPSRDMARRVGEVVFGAGKLAFGVPKLLLAENDIDISDPRQVIWAFAGRAHPEHGEVHFPREP